MIKQTINGVLWYTVMNNPFENITIIDYIKTLEQKNIPSVDYRKHIGIYLEFKAREKAIPLTGSLVVIMGVLRFPSRSV